MENITLEYQPFPFLKYTRKIQGAFPSSYSELLPKQIIAISRLMNQSISETAFLNSLTGIPKFRIKRLDAFHRFNLMELITPLTNIKPHPDFIIPSISISGNTFFAPKAKLAGVTFARFIYADTYFSNYQYDNDKTSLFKFIASLYLPENVPFSESIVQENSAIVSKVNPHILQSIALNYILVKEWLTAAYPMIFVTEEEDNNKDKKPDKPKQNNNAWIKIFDNVVGDDLVNYDKYAELPVHTVFRWMTAKIKENIKSK